MKLYTILIILLISIYQISATFQKGKTKPTTIHLKYNKSDYDNEEKTREIRIDIGDVIILDMENIVCYCDIENDYLFEKIGYNGFKAVDNGMTIINLVYCDLFDSIFPGFGNMLTRYDFKIKVFVGEQIGLIEKFGRMVFGIKD